MEANNVWKTYHHHVGHFYDFLHLNRELRELDFKFNLEKKLKICEQAEALASMEDIPKAFRNLQTLHKKWKDELLNKFDVKADIMNTAKRFGKDLVMPRKLFMKKKDILSRIRKKSLRKILSKKELSFLKWKNY